MRFIEHMNISQCIFSKVKQGKIQDLERHLKEGKCKNTCENNYK